MMFLVETHTPDDLTGDYCRFCGDPLLCFHGLGCECRVCPFYKSSSLSEPINL
jgi:hypothetical protein